MKLPGPDHPIDIALNRKRVQVLFQGHLIAETRGALALKEATYPVVQYIPREDADMAVMSKTERSTHCPYKGDASYYTISRDGVIAENVVWSYEAPYPAMSAITGYLAFYPDQVEIIETDDGDRDAAVRDAVEHTDSGSGASQREHWSASE